MSPSSPFSIAAYRNLYSAHIISIAGTGVTTIALALLAWDLAGSQAGKVLGTALAIKMAAYVGVAPMVGAVAHKIARRQWLIVLDLIRAALICYLPFVTETWEVYCILFVISGCSAGFTPVFQAVIADLVKEETQYQKALSYSRLAYDLEQLLSPALAALLLTLVSFNGLFVLDAISFILSAVLISFAVIPPVQQSERPDRFLGNLVFGVSSYLKTPRLRALLAMYIAVACTSAVMITGTVVYVSDSLGRGESFTALAMAFSGGGSIVAALLLPRWLQSIQIRHAMYIGAVMLAAGMLLAAAGPAWTMFIGIWFFLGAALSMIQVPAGSLVRMSCHPADAGAYFSAHFSLSHLCWLIAYPAAGAAGALLGMQTAFFLMGIVAAFAAVLSWKLYPNPDETVLEHTHDTLEHDHNFIDDSHHGHIGETGKTFENRHRHQPIRHKHRFVIDHHHSKWP